MGHSIDLKMGRRFIGYQTEPTTQRFESDECEVMEPFSQWTKTHISCPVWIIYTQKMKGERVMLGEAPMEDDYKGQEPLNSRL